MGTFSITPETVNGTTTTTSNSPDLSFTKKDISKSRTQSFQLVLSTASLKSLKQVTPLPRNSSIISQKNFQSFIQAPALLNFDQASLKLDVIIGKHTKFDDDVRSGNGNGAGDAANSGSGAAGDSSAAGGDNSGSSAAGGDNGADSDSTGSDAANAAPLTDLTLDALKRLSKSPLTMNEPYKPAKVDLSSFASLTRQLKLNLIDEPPKLNLTDQNTELRLNLLQLNLVDLPQLNLIDLSLIDGLNLRLNLIDFSLQLNSNSSQIESQLTPSHITSQLNPSQRELLNQPFQNKVEPSLNTLPIMNNLKIDKKSIKKPVPAVTPPSNMIKRNSSQNVFDQSPSHTNSVPESFTHLQQIKGLRSPMYIPAVLRITQSESPFDNLQKSQISSKNSSNSIHSFESHDSNKFSDLLKLAPTKKHWVKDEQALKCGLKKCNKVFNFFERRHHCRKCGKIYCKEHTSHYLYINHLAQFTTGGRGTLSKVCDYCIEDYNDFINNEFGLNDGVKVLNVNNLHGKNKNIQPLKMKTGKTEINNEDVNRNDQLVGSVPANWSWSSF